MGSFFCRRPLNRTHSAPLPLGHPLLNQPYMLQQHEQLLKENQKLYLKQVSHIPQNPVWYNKKHLSRDKNFHYKDKMVVYIHNIYWCKTEVSPLQIHWKYHSFARSHHYYVLFSRADSRFAPSQWETALLCNDISHWLGANLESGLFSHYIVKF